MSVFCKHTATKNGLASVIFMSLIVLHGCSSHEENKTTTKIPEEVNTGPECPTISGGGTSIAFVSSAECLSCTSSDEAKAIDNNFESFGSMQMDAGGSGTEELRVTTQPGVIYPAGTVVTLYYSVEGTGQTGMQPRIALYENGVQKQVYSLETAIASGGGAGTKLITSFPAEAQFDSVGFVLSRTAGTSTITSRVFEYCAKS